jgi:hypothetical protein
MDGTLCRSGGAALIFVEIYRFPIAAILALDAVNSPRDGIEPLERDVLLAIVALAIGSFSDPHGGSFDLSHLAVSTIQLGDDEVAMSGVLQLVEQVRFALNMDVVTPTQACCDLGLYIFQDCFVVFHLLLIHSNSYSSFFFLDSEHSGASCKTGGQDADAQREACEHHQFCQCGECDGDATEGQRRQQKSDRETQKSVIR